MSFSSGKQLQNNINTTEAQTLSNKTLDNTTVIQSGADIQTPAIIDPSRSDVKKDTLANLQTYASTASNGQLCYATDSKKMFQVLDGALSDVGGGASGINYITNPDAEVNADGWNNYANTTPGVLPDDFLGSVSGSWSTIAASPSSPLRGSKSFLFGGINSGAGDLQGHGVYSSFTVDSADLAKKMTISFDYLIDDSALTNAVDGMLRVYIYDEDKSELIRVNGEDLQLNANSGTHYAQFQTDSVSTNYRLVIHQALALNIAEDYEIKMDNVQVGPTVIAKGTIVTDWEEYPVTIKGSTTDPTKGTHTEKATWRRVGDSMEIQLSYYQTSSGTAGSGSYYIELPEGYEVDFGKLLGINGFGLDSVGQATFYGGAIFTGNVRVDSTGGFKISLGRNTVQEVDMDSSSFPLSASTWRLSFTASVPIVGWSSNAKMSEDLGGREVVVRAEDSAGTIVLTNAVVVDIPYATVVKDSTNSYDNTTGVFTAPETGYYDVNAAARSVFAITDNQIALIRIYKNDSPYSGKRIEGESATSMDQSIAISDTVYLEKGDTLKVGVFQNGGNSPTLSADNWENRLSIAKRSSPQTILETETVAARYTSNSGQSIPNANNTIVKFEDVQFDTHSAYDTTTGLYTAPVSGYYHYTTRTAFNSSIDWTSGERVILYISPEGESSIREVYEFYGTATNNEITFSSSETIYLEKGQTVGTVLYHNQGASQNLSTVATQNSFSIARIK